MTSAVGPWGELSLPNRAEARRQPPSALSRTKVQAGGGSLRDSAAVEEGGGASAGGGPLALKKSDKKLFTTVPTGQRHGLPSPLVPAKEAALKLEMRLDSETA
jgi:hypothetical protein